MPNYEDIFHNPFASAPCLGTASRAERGEITRLRDSLVFFSIDPEEALAAAGRCLDAAGWRKDNIDHVIALDSLLRGRIVSPSGEPLSG